MFSIRGNLLNDNRIHCEFQREFSVPERIYTIIIINNLSKLLPVDINKIFVYKSHAQRSQTNRLYCTHLYII